MILFLVFNFKTLKMTKKKGKHIILRLNITGIINGLVFINLYERQRNIYQSPTTKISRCTVVLKSQPEIFGSTNEILSVTSEYFNDTSHHFAALALATRLKSTFRRRGIIINIHFRNTISSVSRCSCLGRSVGILYLYRNNICLWIRIQKTLAREANPRRSAIRVGKKGRWTARECGVCICTRQGRKSERENYSTPALGLNVILMIISFFFLSQQKIFCCGKNISPRDLNAQKRFVRF